MSNDTVEAERVGPRKEKKLQVHRVKPIVKASAKPKWFETKAYKYELIFMFPLQQTMPEAERSRCMCKSFRGLDGGTQQAEQGNEQLTWEVQKEVRTNTINLIYWPEKDVKKVGRHKKGSTTWRNSQQQPVQ